MNNEYLTQLRKIKSVSMATVDHHGIPQVRIIDVMLVEGNNLYFCTSRGKAFYKQLIENKWVSILGMTENYQTIRFTGKPVHLRDHIKWINKIFEHNPVMNDVYPGESRYILEPFCLSEGTIEYFDLSTSPITRKEMILGNVELVKNGFKITETCKACGICFKKCPQQCIEAGTPYHIVQEHCLHCGLCKEVCPVKAIRNR